MEGYTIIFLFIGFIFLPIGIGVPSWSFHVYSEAKKNSADTQVQRKVFLYAFFTGLIFVIIGVIFIYFGIISALNPNALGGLLDNSWGG